MSDDEAAKFRGRRPTPLKTPRILPRDVRESNLDIIFRGFYEVQNSMLTDGTKVTARKGSHKRHRSCPTVPNPYAYAPKGGSASSGSTAAFYPTAAQDTRRPDSASSRHSHHHHHSHHGQAAAAPPVATAQRSPGAAPNSSASEHKSDKQGAEKRKPPMRKLGGLPTHLRLPSAFKPSSDRKGHRKMPSWNSVAEFF